MLGKKLINSGPISSGANTFASENFNTVLYTGNGGTQRIGGYINRGAVFNGSNSYIDISTLDFPTNNFSVSVWVYLNSVSASSGYDMILTTAKTNSGGYFYFTFSGNLLYYYDTGAGGAVQSSTTASNNQWYHCVLTKSSTNGVKLYLNNVVVGSNSGFTSDNTSNTTSGGINTIGWYNTGSSTTVNFDGRMDQMRIFNKALSSSEVTTLYGETFASTTISTTDIFEDNSGIALYQFEGNANDTGGISGRLTGDAATFNGSTSLLTMNQASVLGNIFGVTFWINIPSVPPDNDWIFQFSYGQNVGLYIDSNGVLQVYIGSYSANESYATSQTFSTNTWYNVVLTCDGSTTTTYVNGVSKGTGLLRGGQNTTYNYQNVIGGYQTSGSASNHTSMRMEDFRIYNRHITATEASNLYNDTAISSTSLANRYIMKTNFNDSVGTRNLTNNNVSFNHSGTASNVVYQEATRFQPDLVWIKSRSTAKGHIISDSVTNDGTSNSLPFLSSHNADRQYTGSEAGGNYIRNLNSNGFTVGSSLFTGSNGTNFVAWCFNAGSGSSATNNNGSIASTVKANTAAGFSIVKYTGNEQAAQTVGHGLSNSPKIAFIKQLDGGRDWIVPLFTETSGDYLHLNSSGAKQTDTNKWSALSSTTFTVGADPYTNGTGSPYVAYCFHDVAAYQKIGGYTGDGTTSGHVIETGFEPALLIIKGVSHGGSWAMLDNKRSTTNPRDEVIYADASGAEGVNDVYVKANFLSNGFELKTNDSGINMSGRTYIYLAIAADPDETDPTVENSFGVVTYTGNGSTQDLDFGFKPDLVWIKNRSNSNPHSIQDTVTGDFYLRSNATDAAAATSGNNVSSFNQNGITVKDSSSGAYNVNGAVGGTYSGNAQYVAWAWKAGDHDENLPQVNTNGTIDSIVSVNDAAGFSIVNYIGNGTSGATIGTGLSSAPELMIVKRTDTASDWDVYTSATGATKYLILDTDQSVLTASNIWNNTAPSSNVFTVGNHSSVNASGGKYTAYLWYSVSGYSKIATFAGTNYTNAISGLGFAPRFVMIKNTTGAGPWVIHSKPPTTTNPSVNHLRANTTGAQDSGAGEQINFDSDGFTINYNGCGNINCANNTFLYMAFK
jgi:hypothetical protein